VAATFTPPSLGLRPPQVYPPAGGRLNQQALYNPKVFS
jgi:hypothetical protein